MGLGAGISALGGILSSLGLEEAGEAFAAIGNWIMIAGGAITAVVPLIKLLGTTVTVAGTKMSIAGWIAQSGWIWVLAIVAGLAILVTIIAFIVTTI
jgi:hypothetical protein